MEDPVAENIDGALLGGALSLSGFLLQTFFSNPIAGPFVLGISSGAKMAVAFDNDCFFEIYRHIFFLYTCDGCIYRGIDFDRIYFADVKKKYIIWLHYLSEEL